MNGLMHNATRFRWSVVVAVLACHVQATVLVEETFNYTAATGLNGLNGGTGWGGAWSNTDSPWTVTTPGLAVPGLSIASPDNGSTCAATGSNRTITRNFSSAYTNGIVYLGVLLSKDSGSTHSGYWSVVDGYNYGFKLSWASGNWTLAGGGAVANTWGAVSDSGVPIVTGEPILAVLKIDIDTKTGSLYINQASEGTPNTASCRRPGTTTAIPTGSIGRTIPSGASRRSWRRTHGTPPCSRRHQSSRDKRFWP